MTVARVMFSACIMFYRCITVSSVNGRVILYTSTGIEIVSCHQVQLREYILSIHRTHTHAHVHWH